MNKSMKYYLGSLMCAGAIAFSPAVHADESSDAILKVLINKGIVTEAEVAEMKGKVRSDAVNQAKSEVDEEQGLEERVANLEKDTPSWLKGTKFKADLRLRNEVIQNSPNTSGTNRQRIRFRVGMDMTVHEKVKMGFRLATGSSAAPTSTNQTLDGAFNKRAVWVDQAWASLKPIDSITLTGGKFKNPYFRTDMLWDSDINLEGVYGKYKRSLDVGDFYSTVGFFPIENVNYGTDNAESISLLAGQAGLNFKFDGVKVKTGLAYYYFSGLKNNVTGITNARGTNSAYTKDWGILVPTVKVKFKDVFEKVDLGLLGEYAKNNGSTTNNNAFRYGAWIGDAKAKKEGQWRILGQYSEVRQDAFVDAFPDADFTSGRTNGKGFELIVDYALFDNVILSADYYNTQIIGTNTKRQVLQTDFIVKF